MLRGESSAYAGGRDEIRRGADEYAAGRYSEALEAFKKAEPEPPAPVSAELLHDQAAAAFKLGRISDARDLWVRAMTLKDARFEADIRYNLGNCNYAEALAAIEGRSVDAPASQPAAHGGPTGTASPNGPSAAHSKGGSPQGGHPSGGGAPGAPPIPMATPGGGQPDVNKAKSLLDKASEHYVKALRLNPQHTNARANLELAQQLKKEIEKQSTTQPQSQPSSQPGSQPSSQQGSQPSSDSQPSSSDSQQQDENNPSSQPSTQQKPESQPSSDQSEQEPESQPTSDEQQPEPQPTSQEAAESQPGDEQQPVNPLYMTREEAEKLLQKIRDAERARRIELMRREAAKYKPVDRDW